MGGTCAAVPVPPPRWPRSTLCIPRSPEECVSASGSRACRRRSGSAHRPWSLYFTPRRKPSRQLWGGSSISRRGESPLQREAISPHSSFRGGGILSRARPSGSLLHAEGITLPTLTPIGPRQHTCIAEHLIHSKHPDDSCYITSKRRMKMKPNVAKLLPGAGILALSFLISCPLWAQAAGAVLSGAVSGPAGAAISNAEVSVKNVATGQLTHTRTNSAGIYNVPDLMPGDYEVSVSVEGFSIKAVNVTRAAGAGQTVDLPLQAPSSNAAAPSLGDLGFTPEQTKGNAQEQARLDRRSRMLKTHQRLGLITTAPLIATLILANGAAGRNSSGSGRELH